MINPNWNRWIFSSASKYFKDTLGASASTVPFLIESGQADANGDSYEFRFSGPLWTQLSRNQWRGSIIINMLIKAAKKERDLQKIYRMVGFVEAAFVQTIPVLTYGSDNGDTPWSQIGCLELVKERGMDIKVIHYGQVVLELPLLQSTVEACYRIDLDTP